MNIITIYNNEISKNDEPVRQHTIRTIQIQSKKQVELNDEARGTYNFSNQIKFKTSMIRSKLCDNSDAYILVSGTITSNGAGAADAAK